MPNKKPTTRAKRKARAGLNKLEEAFCQAYTLNGNNGAEAIATAMPQTRRWKAQTRAERASRLLATDKVRARVEELAQIARERANAEFSMTADEVLWRLTMMARANLKTFLQIDADGQPTIAFADTDESKLYALCEVTVEDLVKPREGTRTKIKLPDRIAALKLLGQVHGLFADNVKLNGGNPIPVVLSSAEAKL